MDSSGGLYGVQVHYADVAAGESDYGVGGLQLCSVVLNSTLLKIIAVQRLD